MSQARCLCGDVTLEHERPFEWMSHCHCFVGSMAPWYTIADDLPQHAEYLAA
jgi:hypothetical protein